MRILFVASEVFPLVKTGGLADIAGALPVALTAAGEDVRILMPGYPEALDKAVNPRPVGLLGDPFGLGSVAHLIEATLPGSDVPLWLIDCPPLYQREGGLYQGLNGQDYPDNFLRFGLLSWAAAHLCTEGSPVAWKPDVLHCHDWQAGLAPAYLNAWPLAQRPATVFTVHNIAYQGQFYPGTLGQLGLPRSMYTLEGLEYYDTVSFLKAGLVYSDRLSTVSQRYAREIQNAPHGCGMEGLLAHRSNDLVGILNGADYGVWDPATDASLPHPYSPHHCAKGKAANKAALQAELGLEVNPTAPLLVIVSRLNDLKGMDMVLAILPAVMRQGAQLAVLGAGDRNLEEAFRVAASNNPHRVAVSIGYNESLAHKLIAAGDILLMPSRFEPCGLTQLYAFRYGTVPVAHATGGLADTVMNASYDGLMTGMATGFVFEHANAGAFQWAVERAMEHYARPEQWQKLQTSCMQQDFSWGRSAARYIEMYRGLEQRKG